jgi:hypothetical protein
MKPRKTDCLIKRLMRAYPKPVSAIDHKQANKCEYCVGGAYLQHRTRPCFWTRLWFRIFGFKPEQQNFPCCTPLAEMLRIDNPALSSNDGWYAAWTITSANDAGHFVQAWDTLRLALTYDKKESIKTALQSLRMEYVKMRQAGIIPLGPTQMGADPHA